MGYLEIRAMLSGQNRPLEIRVTSFLRDTVFALTPSPSPCPRCRRRCFPPATTWSPGSLASGLLRFPYNPLWPPYGPPTAPLRFATVSLSKENTDRKMENRCPPLPSRLRGIFFGTTDLGPCRQWTIYIVAESSRTARSWLLGSRKELVSDCLRQSHAKIRRISLVLVLCRGPTYQLRCAWFYSSL